MLKLIEKTNPTKRSQSNPKLQILLIDKGKQQNKNETHEKMIISRSVFV